MNAEFNWWLLIVGLVVGAGLVWYVLMDGRRREVDLDRAERPREAAWLSATIEREGWVVPPEAAERLLELHAAYLDAPPPDDVVDVAPDDRLDAALVGEPPAAEPAADAPVVEAAAAEAPVTDGEDLPADPPIAGSTESELAGDHRVDLGA